mmetsp:Transcript_71861/g.187337  ORF Transcript_71861/g.187337 Transcript_71861/m.187337 type:complete len:509 (-) Transcript_71861:249-1775(-)
MAFSSWERPSMTSVASSLARSAVTAAPCPRPPSCGGGADADAASSRDCMRRRSSSLASRKACASWPWRADSAATSRSPQSALWARACASATAHFSPGKPSSMSSTRWERCPEAWLKVSMVHAFTRSWSDSATPSPTSASSLPTLAPMSRVTVAQTTVASSLTCSASKPAASSLRRSASAVLPSSVSQACRRWPSAATSSARLPTSPCALSATARASRMAAPDSSTSWASWLTSLSALARTSSRATAKASVSARASAGWDCMAARPSSTTASRSRTGFTASSVTFSEMACASSARQPPCSGARSSEALASRSRRSSTSAARRPRSMCAWSELLFTSCSRSWCCWERPAISVHAASRDCSLSSSAPWSSPPAAPVLPRSFCSALDISSERPAMASCKASMSSARRASTSSRRAFTASCAAARASPAQASAAWSVPVSGLAPDAASARHRSCSMASPCSCWAWVDWAYQSERTEFSSSRSSAARCARRSSREAVLACCSACNSRRRASMSS